MKIANETSQHHMDSTQLHFYSERLGTKNWGLDHTRSLHTIWAVTAKIHPLLLTTLYFYSSLSSLLSIRRRKGRGCLWLAGVPSTFAIVHLGIGSWINHTLSFKENPSGSQKGHKNIQLFNGNEKGDVFLRNGKIFTHSNTISATNALLVYMYIPC